MIKSYGVICADMQEVHYIYSILPNYGLTEYDVESVEAYSDDGRYQINILADRKKIQCIARNKAKRFSTLKLKMAKKQALEVADGLGYSDSVKFSISAASTESEIEKILTSARLKAR